MKQCGKSEYGRIESPHQDRVPPLDELLAQITPENRQGETDWGSEVGREKVEW
jgi:antitoxin component of MazEF toxin-antitoxin module